MGENGNNMDSNNTNSGIPKLRFPGFTGKWEELPLSHFLFEHKTKSDGKCEVHSVSVAKGVVNQAAYLGRSYAAADTSKYNLAKPNDIIYTKSPTGAFPYGIVKQNKNPYNVIVSPLYAVYSPINKYIGYIIDSYFESPVTANNYLSSLVQKGAKNTIQISNDTFVSKTVCLPTNPAEQQKIAECLSEIDKLIAAQGQKVDALKEKKKGLMQQMFPQKGETVPRLRFPGFTGDWTEKKLREVFSRITRKNSENNKNVLTISAQYGLINQLDFFKKSVSAIDLTGYYLLHKGELAYNKSSSQGRPVGAIKPLKLYDKGVVSTLYMCFKCKDSREIGFWEQYFDAGILDKEIASIAQEGARNHGLLNISTRGFFELSVIVPTLPEQRKIASCLSALDDTIAAESDKLEVLKNHKKGLMQQLFPQPTK